MKHVWIFLWLIFLLVGGCRSQKKIVIKYYTINLGEITDTTKIVNSPVSEEACEIEPVNLNQAFAGFRIANRQQSHEITYYVHHQWAVKPEDAFTEINLHKIQNWGLFGNVSTRFWKLVPGYQIQTYIDALETVQNGDQLSTHLKVEFRLVDYKTKNTLVMHTADVYKPLGKKNINLFAQAVSESYYQQLLRFSEKIRDHFNL